MSKSNTPKVLPNIGNTCYMNSVLQWLIATQQMTQYFKNNGYKSNINDRRKLQLSEACTNLIYAYFNKDEVAEYYLSDVKKFIEVINSQFEGENQLDAYEFLSALFEGLRQELNIADNAKYRNFTLFNNSNVQELSDEFLAKSMNKEKSLITQLFQGHIWNIFKCQPETHEFYDFEDFTTLSLEIPSDKKDGRAKPRIDINDCIKETLSKNVFDIEHGFTCRKYNKNTSFSKHIEVFRAPEILIIHFNRFKLLDNNIKKKDEASITFPAQKFDFNVSIPNHTGSISYKYDIFGIVHHEGSFSSGHYYAEVKYDFDGKKWFWCNDKFVKSINKPKLSGKTPYILFYARNKDE